MQHTSVFSMTIYITPHFMQRLPSWFLTFSVQVTVWMYTVLETAICINPDTSSNGDSHITTQIGYKHTFWQNVVFTEKLLSLHFHKKKCSSVRLPRNGPVFLVSYQIVYKGVTKNCCFIRDMIRRERSQKMPKMPGIAAPASHKSIHIPERPHA